MNTVNCGVYLDDKKIDNLKSCSVYVCSTVPILKFY